MLGYQGYPLSKLGDLPARERREYVLNESRPDEEEDIDITKENQRARQSWYITHEVQQLKVAPAGPGLLERYDWLCLRHANKTANFLAHPVRTGAVRYRVVYRAFVGELQPFALLQASKPSKF